MLGLTANPAEDVRVLQDKDTIQYIRVEGGPDLQGAWCWSLGGGIHGTWMIRPSIDKTTRRRFGLAFRPVGQEGGGQLLEGWMNT